MTNKTLLTLAAIIEASTGLALMLVPAFVVRLLFGEELDGMGTVLGRLAGLGLLSFAAACWPLHGPGIPAIRAMLLYNTLAAAYLAYLLAAHGIGEAILVAVTVLHAVFAVLFAWQWFRPSREI